MYSNSSTLKPIVGIVWTNSFCFNLKSILVFPAPSSPSVMTRISILGPICTRLSFLEVIRNVSSYGCCYQQGNNFILKPRQILILKVRYLNLLTFVNVIGIEPSGNSCCSCNEANCCLCDSAVFNISLISDEASKTLASSCLETWSQFTQTVATCTHRIYIFDKNISHTV